MRKEISEYTFGVLTDAYMKGMEDAVTEALRWDDHATKFEVRKALWERLKVFVEGEPVDRTLPKGETND